VLDGASCFMNGLFNFRMYSCMLRSLVFHRFQRALYLILLLEDAFLLGPLLSFHNPWNYRLLLRPFYSRLFRRNVDLVCKNDDWSYEFVVILYSFYQVRVIILNQHVCLLNFSLNFRRNPEDIFGIVSLLLFNLFLHLTLQLLCWWKRWKS